MDWNNFIMGIITAIIASSGFWAFVLKAYDRKNSVSKLVLGIAHDIIIQRCETYLARGYITFDEHENLYKYLYVPYKERGGNGTIDILMKEVNELSMRSKL